jgi:hypothetical protein
LSALVHGRVCLRLTLRLKAHDMHLPARPFSRPPDGSRSNPAEGADRLRATAVADDARYGEPGNETKEFLAALIGGDLGPRLLLVG